MTLAEVRFIVYTALTMLLMLVGIYFNNLWLPTLVLLLWLLVVFLMFIFTDIGE